MDQASRLRSIIKRNEVIDRKELQEENHQRARVITVTSGKGGVGKSNVSVNLAIELRRQGQKVIIFDADFGLANVEVIFGVIPRYNLFDIIYNKMTIQEVLTEGPLGVQFLSGGSGVHELLKLNQNQLYYLVDKLKELDQYADVIIIDTGAGINETVLKFILASHEVLLVTTPEPTAVTDAYAVLKAIKNSDISDKKNLYLLINRVASEKEGIEVFEKLSRVAKRFLHTDVLNVGFLPEDRFLTKAVHQQKPVLLVYPKAEISKQMTTIAANLMNAKEYQSEQPRGLSGVLGRFFNRE